MRDGDVARARVSHCVCEVCFGGAVTWFAVVSTMIIVILELGLVCYGFGLLR